MYESLYPYTTDEMASKYLTLILTGSKKDLDEYEIMLVGKYNISTGEVQGVDHCIIQFDEKAESSTPISNPDTDDRKIYVK